MRVSTRGRYGLRAMFELASHYGQGPMLMSTVAERQNLSRKHLHALLTTLKSADLVRSFRGPGGGFQLARPPAQIRLSEVLRALEGPLSLVHCVEDREACDRADTCVARGVWRQLSDAIHGVLDGATLQDLVGQEHAGCPDPKRKQKRRNMLRDSGSTVGRSKPASRRPRTKAGTK